MQALEAQLGALSVVEKLLHADSPRVLKELHSRWQVDKRILTTAAPFAWSDEATRAVLEASKSIPLDTGMTRWNLATPTAFWRFENPLPFQTISQAAVGVRAIGFGWLETTQRGFGMPCHTWLDAPKHEWPLIPSQTLEWHEGATPRRDARSNADASPEGVWAGWHVGKEDADWARCLHGGDRGHQSLRVGGSRVVESTRPRGRAWSRGTTQAQGVRSCHRAAARRDSRRAASQGGIPEARARRVGGGVELQVGGQRTLAQSGMRAKAWRQAAALHHAVRQGPGGQAVQRSVTEGV